MIFQIVSLVGAVFVLLAFAAQQLGHINADSRRYQIFNLVGGACLCVAAVAAKQFGFILLEGTWTVASVYGLWKLLRTED